MVKQREIVGVFVRERNVFESADGLTRTIIGEIDCVDDRGREYTKTIKGEDNRKELCPGLAFRFYGYTKDYTNKRTGETDEQFIFDSFVVETPAGQEAVTTYLQQCDGIGPARARVLWNLHQDDAIRFLREEHEQAAEEIGISVDAAKSASELLVAQLAVEKTTVELYGLLHGRGLPKFKDLVENIILQYGSESAETIRRNPYLLMQFRGCGFLKTDKLFIEFGHNPARLKRQTLCAWYGISADSRGDTWLPWTHAKDALTSNIGGSNVRIEDALELGLRAGLLSERIENGRRWIAEKRKADAEGRVSKFINCAREESLECGVFWPAIDLLRGIVSDHQFGQLVSALTELICVLAGSPGTGKTFCAAALIKLVIRAVGGNHVAACAPTGKAAVRLTEGLQEHGVCLKATTIHTLLKVKSGENGDGWSFQHDINNPLPFKYVFIDESSMIDTPLMASLLAARGRGTHFIFIGDPNQLAPVGHGAPLRDFIRFGLPTGTLTKIERNDGLIVRACAEIRDHKRFTPADKPILPDQNLALFERDTSDKVIRTLTDLMGSFIQSRKYDPIWDIQIIVAVNKKSPLGRKPLNEKLQDLLNPDGERAKGSPFRVGDKIINGKNGWFPASKPNAEGANQDNKYYCANGEQAAVVRVETNRTFAVLTAPDREIIIPRGTKGDDDSGTTGDDEESGTGCNWELGFAISCHKAQGSEFKIAIVIIDDYNGAKMVQSRQWIYTAISRAKKLCLLIGRKVTALDACKRDALFSRKTFLVERMKELESPVVIESTSPAPDHADDIFEDLLVGVI